MTVNNKQNSTIISTTTKEGIYCDEYIIPLIIFITNCHTGGTIVFSKCINKP